MRISMQSTSKSRSLMDSTLLYSLLDHSLEASMLKLPGLSQSLDQVLSSTHSTLHYGQSTSMPLLSLLNLFVLDTSMDFVLLLLFHPISRLSMLPFRIPFLHLLIVQSITPSEYQAMISLHSTWSKTLSMSLWIGSHLGNSSLWNFKGIFTISTSHWHLIMESSRLLGLTSIHQLFGWKMNTIGFNFE